MKRFRNNLDYRDVFENREGKYSPHTEREALRYWDHVTDAEIERQQKREDENE